MLRTASVKIDRESRATGKARCVEVTGPGGASVLGAERSEESADLVMDTEAPAAGNSKRKAPPAAAQGGKSESKRKRRKQEPIIKTKVKGQEQTANGK